MPNQLYPRHSCACTCWVESHVETIATPFLRAHVQRVLSTHVWPTPACARCGVASTSSPPRLLFRYKKTSVAPPSKTRHTHTRARARAHTHTHMLHLHPHYIPRRSCESVAPTASKHSVLTHAVCIMLALGISCARVCNHLRGRRCALQRGSTPVHWAVTKARPNNMRILKLLVEKKADVNAQTFFKQTPLHQAAETGQCRALSSGCTRCGHGCACACAMHVSCVVCRVCVLRAWVHDGAARGGVTRLDCI